MRCYKVYFFRPPRLHRRMDRELDPVTSTPKRRLQLGANLSTFAGLLAFRTVRRSQDTLQSCIEG